MLFTGSNANEIWKQAVEKLTTNTDESMKLPCRTGSMYELPHAMLTLYNPRQKFVSCRIPPLSIAFALAELVWILNGKDEANIVNFWNPAYARFTGNSKVYHGAYGDRIRRNVGFDQLERAYYALKNNPESRQVVIQIWDSKKDFPNINGEPVDSDIPCNICSLLKIRNNRLEWTQIMRSNDILLGLPYNLVQYTGLQEVLAGWLNVDVGSYTHYSDSLHLYDRDIAKIGIADNITFNNSDSLSISKIDFDNVIKEIYGRMVTLATQECNDETLLNIADLNSSFDAYNNMMAIITAYVANKHKSDVTGKIANMCLNRCYLEMWNRWVKR